MHYFEPFTEKVCLQYKLGSSNYAKEWHEKDPELKGTAERKASGINLTIDDASSRSPWFYDFRQQMLHLQVINGVVYRVVGGNAHVIIPEYLNEKIIQLNRDERGHFGINKVYGKIQQQHF